MKNLCTRHATRLLPLFAAIMASSGLLLAQDQPSIPLAPAIEEAPLTDGVPLDGAIVDGATVTESEPIESLVIPQDAAIADTPMPPVPSEEFSPQAPQLEHELPPFNADEMADEDRDDLLRGPVHEAFAEQVNSDPTPNMIVTRQPPEPVEELPPELQPSGREVEWISGYWAWDEDQDDFIWISGVWREIPQGCRWLPGYWTEVEGGHQWVSGTWVSTQTTEIQYLADAPPETLELGPVGVAPASDQIWIPGTWIWNDTQYAWRPGYWSAGYENWVWVPARYQCTPRGYYHCSGYWDYPVNRRGVLFAPSYFNRQFHGNRITRYTPRVVVSTNLLTTHFWVRPRYRHYYFGNYYDVAYSNRGLMPWHQYPQQRRTFDPLYAYYSRGQRSHAYQNQLSVQFNLFVNQPNRRPAITFRDQDRWQREEHREVRANDLLGNRFQNLVDNAPRDRSGLQFVRMENRQREQVQLETRQLRELVNQRRDVERSLTQLQKHHDGNLKTQLPDREAERPDLQEKLNHRNELRDAKNKDAPASTGDRDAKSRDEIPREEPGRDLKGRNTVADALRLNPKTDAAKVEATKGAEIRQRIDNAAGGLSKTSDDVSSQIEQKSATAKERAASRAQDTAARKIERDGSKERLKLPPTTRSIDVKPSAGVAASNKLPGSQNAARDQIQRAESRVRSNIQEPANNALKNVPAIRNTAEGRERTRANDAPAVNSPSTKRESIPRSAPATSSTPDARPAPAIRSTPNEKATPAPRTTPAERATQAPRHESGRATPNHGGGVQRSTPSVKPPQGDTGSRARSNAAPAANPGRLNGGAGGGGAAGGKRGKGK